MTQADIARAIGLSQGVVSYYLSLLDLDEDSRRLVADGHVSAADAVGAVRAARKRARGGRSPGRPRPALQADHFSFGHPLADKARIRCELAGHEAVKYGRDRVANAKVACGACWEYVIRADERGEGLPADEPAPSAREERMRVVATLPMLNGATPDGEHVTASQAAERLGVTRRTIERYKASLAMAGDR